MTVDTSDHGQRFAVHRGILKPAFQGATELVMLHKAGRPLLSMARRVTGHIT